MPVSAAPHAIAGRGADALQLADEGGRGRAAASRQDGGTVTARITLERIGAREVRVTVTADIWISGELGVPSVPARRVGGGGRQSDAALQEFLTVDQAAEVLNVGRDNVYSLIRTGQLRSIKIGRLRRISRQWIAEFAGRQGPGSRSSH